MPGKVGGDSFEPLFGGDQPGEAGTPGAVTRIIPGTGISVAPAGGTGNVTVTNTEPAVAGSGIAGPNALGTVGVAATVRRSDQIAPAFRSDLPLATTWFIDPVNGSDARTNGGTTSATALKTMQELCRRWWSAEIQSNTTVTILGNVPAGDVCGWNFTIRSGVVVTFVGSLGPTTGFGGAAIDNTVYSGSVTGFVAASATPAADDIELTDAAVPVSYTASGVLANGIILKATSGTHSGNAFYALKDLGAKTLRMTVPMANTVNPMNTALTVGDTYSAYAMWQMPTQFFGAVAIQRIAIDSLFLNGGTANLTGTMAGARASRIWYGMAQVLFNSSTAGVVNPFFSGGSLTLENNNGADIILSGGGGRGNGTTASMIVQGGGTYVWQGSPCLQGTSLFASDNAMWAIETTIAIHDMTAVPMLTAAGNGLIAFNPPNAGGGLSGKGNTGKIVVVSDNSRVTWGLNARTPPFIAGVTTDASPVQIGSVSYAVSALPTVTNTTLSPAANFPIGASYTQPANAAAVVAMTNAPAGSPGTPVRYVAFPDGAGGFITVPSLS